MYITGEKFKVSMFANNEQKIVEFNTLCTLYTADNAVYFYNTQNNRFSCIICENEMQFKVLMRAAIARLFNKDVMLINKPIIVPRGCRASYRFFGGDYERIFTSIH